MKVKFIHVADARGKINGAVASRNRFANYFRTKTSPVNPDTTAQRAVRNNFTLNSQAWRGLTAAQRDSWNNASANFTKSNIFGDNVRLTGAQLYNRFNRNLYEVGTAPVATPPLPSAVTPPSSMSVVATGGANTMVLTYAPAIPASESWIIYATPPVSAGKSFVKNLYRKIGVLVTANASPYDIKTLYNAKFGTGWQTAGQKVFISVKPVITATGVDGQVLQTSTIVV